jgi:copper chaperone
MEKIILKVNGMSCSHCEKAVIKAVSALPGVSSVGVNLVDKTVSVDYQAGAAGPADFKAAIEDQGYDVA